MKQLLIILSVILLLAMPVIVSGFVHYDVNGGLQFVKQLATTLAFFSMPVILFYRNVRIYLMVLLPLILLTPLFIFSIYLFAIQPGFELIALVMQTNVREAKEALMPYALWLVLFVLGYILVYTWMVRRITVKSIPLSLAISISCAGLLVALSIIYFEKQLYYKNFREITRNDLIDTYHYPFSLVSGANQARVILKQNDLSRARNFHFGAFQMSRTDARQIHVLIIGESSRYDHWQVNGYSRETSPRLSKRKNLLTYNNVIAAANYTWVSVPQIITRATPNDYDRQYREKSIMSVFQEAGFKTCWLSNQSADEIFWTGSIVLHARAADVSIFSPSYSPNFEFENFHDERLLPLLDSVLHATDDDMFIVLHTMGNHWEYSRRYPASFDYFKPSGYTMSLDPHDRASKEAIVNSYDNSIRYADYVIDSVISLVDRRNAVSSVSFISDHGEDLYDRHDGHLDFHMRPSRSTLHVPFFIWTSSAYDRQFPAKRNRLQTHQAMAIGAGNFFYTWADIGNLSFPSFDSTRSIASRAFQPVPQQFYNDEKRPQLFVDESLVVK